MSSPRRWLYRQGDRRKFGSCATDSGPRRTGCVPVRSSSLAGLRDSTRSADSLPTIFVFDSLILPSPSFTQPLHADTRFRLIIDLDSRPRQLVNPPGAPPFFPWCSFLPVHALEFVSLAESCSAPHMFYFVQLWTQDWSRQMPRNADTKRSEIELRVRSPRPRASRLSKRCGFNPDIWAKHSQQISVYTMDGTAYRRMYIYSGVVRNVCPSPARAPSPASPRHPLLRSAHND